MTKAEMVQMIAEDTGFNPAEVKATVESFMENMNKSLISGNNVFLRGFGSFKLQTRKAKKVRNISKGTAMNLPAHKIVKFKPAERLKNSVKENVPV